MTKLFDVCKISYAYPGDVGYTQYVLAIPASDIESLSPIQMIARMNLRQAPDILEAIYPVSATVCLIEHDQIKNEDWFRCIPPDRWIKVDIENIDKFTDLCIDWKFMLSLQDQIATFLVQTDECMLQSLPIKLEDLIQL